MNERTAPLSGVTWRSCTSISVSSFANLINELMTEAKPKFLMQNVRQEVRPCVSLILREFRSGLPVVSRCDWNVCTIFSPVRYYKSYCSCMHAVQKKALNIAMCYLISNYFAYLSMKPYLR